VLSWLVYAAIGRVIIYLWMKFPLPEKRENYPSRFIHKLHECALCSGTYIYPILALCFGVDIFQDLFGYTGAIPQIVGQIATGMATSWLVYVFSAGWSSLNEVTIV